ncbi:MAG: hypothetical protein H6R04_689 [Burkholderiaceae bacterium]|nr:hypothetical protein [Burkholderiaceae bacterium]
MATGILGVLASGGSLTYTPMRDAKLKVSATGTFTINSASFTAPGTANTVNSVEVFIGANQTVTVSSGAVTVVSTLEG